MNTKVLTINRISEKAIALTKSVAISIGVATIYFLMTVLNPLASLTGGASIMALANVRFSNMLRALVIVSPASAVGVALGSHAFNIYSGKVGLMAYPIIPLIAIGVGLGMYKLSNMWGKSTFKDLTLIGLGGFIMGLVITLNLTTIASVFENGTFKMLLTGAAQWKILTHTLVPLMGYPLVKIFGGMLNEKNTRSE